MQELRIADPFAVARKVLPDLRRRSDLVVALLHFRLVDVDRFLKANPEIDVALVGHHVGREGARKVGRSIVVSDGALGEKLGRLTLQLDGRGRVLSFRAERLPIGEELAVDDGVQQEVEGFNEAVRRKKISEDVFFLPPEKDLQTYVGAEACAPCHPVIYQQWSNTPHAYALNSLREKGADYNPECVICHVVGYRSRKGFLGAEKTPQFAGVQCESCHGAGAGHPRAKSMTARVPEEVCRKCHNDKHSPAFDYPAYLSMADQCNLP